MSAGVPCLNTTYKMADMQQANGHDHQNKIKITSSCCSMGASRDERMSCGGGGGGYYYFQMPLHYPRYKKSDYESMPEWKLNRLLAEYGLPLTGDLSHKRNLAMGTFLWPSQY